MNRLNIQDPFLFGEWFDICWFHSCYTTGLTTTIHERLGYGISQLVAELDGGEVQRFYFSRSEWSNIGEKYLQQVIQNPELLKKLLSDVRRASDDLWNFSWQLKDQNIVSMNKKEQIEVLKNYHHKEHNVWTLGQVLNVLELENSFLTNYLKDYLQSIVPSDDVIKVFQALVTPRELSQSQKEERNMLALALESNPQVKLVSHHQKYSWIHFGWTGPSLTLEYFTEVHRGLFQEGKVQEKLDALHQADEFLLEQKERYIRDLNISEEKQQLFRLLEELLFIKAHRMDALFLSFEAIQPLLKKIAQDNFISLKQLYTLYIDWIIENLEKGEFDAHGINEIMQYSLRYYDGENFHLLVGQEARDFMVPLQALLPTKAKVNELKGECAYPGKISGRVCIVNRASEMGKFQDQDILVSNVTDPSLLPIMKKASAFVTNMGGLTCHAAIVARELHVPCVVGTKTATHVFQDGDMVEVDATSGVVKKI